jgi:hypothetical protein
LHDRIVAEDRGTWACDPGECRTLVARLAALTPDQAGATILQAA